MKLIVGLGNPGPTYSQNRHNIGFLTIDKILSTLSANDVTSKKFFGELYKFRDILLLKPTTFMNLSGKSVLAVKNFYKIDLEDILVIHDDIDLNFGAVRLKKGGGHGGHNGLKSIDSAIGKDYYRLRLGVGKPERKSEVVSYVLGDFEGEDARLLDSFTNYAKDTAIAWLESNDFTELKSKYSQKDSKYLND